MADNKVVALAPSGSGFQANVRVIKAALGPAKAIGTRTFEIEDEWYGLYGAGALGDGIQVIEPRFMPRELENLCHQNNALSVCINAMVTNVHLTGYEIKLWEEDGASETDEDIQIAKRRLEAFFEETYPGESIMQLRKRVGYDLERTGNAYIEVIRNLAKEIVYLRRLDPKMMRLIRLDEPKIVPIKLNRGGEQIEAMVMMRYRRYAQRMHESAVLYFKQFNCPMDLHASRGTWALDGEALAVNNRASEVIHLTKHEDSLTPYGVPSWVPQLPSVLGSRRAEELNLDYFDAGGVPPIMVFVHGGTLTSEAANALRDHLHAGKRAKNSIPVIEAVSTGGSIDSAGSVKITVERFGSERQSDSMFEKYDDKCEQRIRRAWRLPPLFVGISSEYNFATAAASYQVAEAQVFAPERDEFDEMINRQIMPQLDPSNRFQFKSRPVNVRDVESQLKAIETAARGKTLSRAQLVELLNSVTDLSMRVENEDIADISGNVDPMAGMPPAGETLSPTDYDDAENDDDEDDDEDEDAVTEAGAADEMLKSDFATQYWATPAASRPPDFNRPQAENLAHALYDVFHNGGEGPVMVRLLAEVRRLMPDEAIVFKTTLAELAGATPYSPELGPAYVESITDVVLGMIETRAA